MQDPDSFLHYFEKVRGRTLRVAAHIPAEAFEASPTGTGFSFGDILRHLAGTERFMFAENALGRPGAYAGHESTLASGPAATFAYLNRLHEESMAIFRGLGVEGFQAKCMTPGGTSMAVWKWLRAMIEHEAHHRGQIYTYLSISTFPRLPSTG